MNETQTLVAEAVRHQPGESRDLLSSQLDMSRRKAGMALNALEKQGLVYKHADKWYWHEHKMADHPVDDLLAALSGEEREQIRSERAAQSSRNLQRQELLKEAQNNPFSGKALLDHLSSLK